MENENKKEEVGRNVPKRLKELFIMIAPFVLVLLVGSFYASHKQSQQLTSEFKTALSGQSGSGQYSEVLNQVFSYYKSQSAIEFPYSHELDNSDMLEMKSFESKDSINQISGILKNTLTELDSYDSKMNEIIQGARSIIQNSNLSQSEKDEALAGFDKSFEDQTSQDLGSKRIVAMRNLYEKVLTLYEFMLANFDDYQIKTNDSGNQQVYFYTDSNITRYNQISADVQKLSIEFQKANDEFIAYKNKNFKSSGLDINATDVQSYFNQ